MTLDVIKTEKNTTASVTSSGLYVYDSVSVWPKKIPFEWCVEDHICTTKHGSMVYGYRFLDANKRTVWECQYGDHDGEKAVRFAKKRKRFVTLEDKFNWGRLLFEKMCEEEGVEFESAKEKWEFYEEFRQEHLQKTGFDMDDLYHSEAAINMKRSRPGPSS